jgi:hypothetical protein
MKRRSLFKAALLSNLPIINSEFANASEFSGKYLLSIQVDGGWDVTLFCDPKENIPGEKIITNWSEIETTQEAGNIKYAPFANNAKLFEKHHKKMLVINGVDFQTNAHGIGVTNSWSGRTASGYPSLGALYAAAENYSTNSPMPYLSFGGYSFAANLINATIINNPNRLKEILTPQVKSGVNTFDNDYFELIQTMLIKDGINKVNDISSLGGNYERRKAYLESVQNFNKLAPLADILPTNADLLPKGRKGDLSRQAQLALLSFKSGITISADLVQGALDTHSDNDDGQENPLSDINDSIDYIWEYATELGIADRLVLFIGSDFSRTPYYNSANGKDHWPISSYIIMENNVNYTNQVIGSTDERQNSIGIDTNTNATKASGTKLVAAHVHQAMRSYLGISEDPLVKKFPFNDIQEKFNFYI